MFSRRKPKHEEDEPLVPHGLVWQATEEPAESPSPETPQKPNPPAPPVEINPKSDLSSHTSIVTTARKPVASPEPFPPVPWRSQDQLKREISASSIRSGNVPCLKGPRLIHSANIDRPSTDDKRGKELLANFRNQLRAVAKGVSSQRQDMSRFMAGMLRESSSVFSRKYVILKGHQRILGERYEFAEFQRTVADATHVGLQRVRAACSRARPYCANFKLRAAGVLGSASAYIRREARRIRTAHVRVRLKRNAISSAWKDAGMRTKLEEWQPQARILLARVKAEWTLKRRGLAHDSRLWTSLGMGALCALLALAFISVVRHYATESLPSRHTSREIVPVTSSVVKPLSAESPKHIVPPALQVRKPKAVQPTRPHTAPIRPTSHPKPRRAEDDDYVARDTYVYYGDSATRSH